MHARTSTALAVLAVLFLGSVGGAWAWFHVGVSADSTERLRFTAHRAVEGWRFSEEPLGPVARDILATTNLLNGTFTGGSRERITVFAAEWSAANSRQMSVVQHTPDVCWVGAGWVPVNAGQPDRVMVPLQGRPTEFQCRMFAAPDGSHRELVLWCTLVGGQVLEESGRWRLEAGAADASSRYELAGRRMAAGQLASNLRHRRKATAHKQFVRFSVPSPGSWEDALQDLSRFAPQWLALNALAGPDLPPSP